MSSEQATADVAIIGAGPAGLQAALTLGRMRRRVVVLDTGRYRNDPASHMHNFLAHDGTRPAELRRAARADIDRYDTVALREGEVIAIEGERDGFALALRDGEPVRARRVLIAAGASDALPPIPGAAELFGDAVAHCPFCHGHEFLGTPVGIVGGGFHAAMKAAMLAPIVSRLVVLTGGEELDDAARAALDRLGAEVRAERVIAVRRADEGLELDLDGADAPLALGGLFVSPTWITPAFLDGLGLERSPQGAVRVDAFGRTSRAGVSAAGDIAQSPGQPQPMSAVLAAASSGLIAAAALAQDLAAADAGLTLPG